MQSDQVLITQTERLVMRQMTTDDAAFVCELLNSPKFLKYIGDRGVRTADDAAKFITERYTASYREHGYGLYIVIADDIPIGMCGFVRRDTLPGPDIGFAFLPVYEGKGFGFESANALMDYGRDILGFNIVYAITSLDNVVSGRLLKKLGFEMKEEIIIGNETLKLFSKII